MFKPRRIENRIWPPNKPKKIVISPRIIYTPYILSEIETVIVEYNLKNVDKILSKYAIRNIDSNRYVIITNG